MAAHSLAHRDDRPVRRVTTLFRLDWGQFWLLLAILGGLLGLVAVVFLASLAR